VIDCFPFLSKWKEGRGMRKQEFRWNLIMDQMREEMVQMNHQKQESQVIMIGRGMIREGIRSEVASGRWVEEFWWIFQRSLG
jgi:hypothetical protein